MLIQEDLTQQIIHSFYQVYNELGYGFVESVYERALAIVMAEGARSVERQRSIKVHFRGHLVGTFRADLVVADAVLLELKAVRALEASHKAQLLNALKATDLEVGLLLNFGPRPEFKRVVCSHHIDFPSPNERPNRNPEMGAGLRDDPSHPRDPR